MIPFRVRRDRVDREIRTRTAQPGHPLRAEIVVTVQGRKALGRPAPRRYRFGLDLLFGQASEAELLRQVYSGIESTAISDLHISQRSAVLGELSDRTARALCAERARDSEAA